MLKCFRGTEAPPSTLSCAPDIRILIFLCLSPLCPQGTGRTWQPSAIASQTPASRQHRMGPRQHNPPVPLSLLLVHLVEGRTITYRDSTRIDADDILWTGLLCKVKEKKKKKVREMCVIAKKKNPKQNWNSGLFQGNVKCTQFVKQKPLWKQGF